MNFHLPQRQIQEAVRLIKQGGLIAFPTETSYGLGVDPLNSKALERLFTVKHRARDKAILVLVQGKDHIHLLAGDVPPVFVPLMDKFWPGPLTLVFPAKPGLSHLLTGGSSTIGLRHSSHPVASQLVKTFSGPITATSANLSGQIAANTAEEVKEIFSGEIDLILDGGQTPGGPGSTLVGCNKFRKITCLRPGVVSFNDVTACSC